MSRFIGERAQLVLAAVPVDMATAGLTGDWISLKGWDHVDIIFAKAAGGAAEDPVITVQQATAIAGTGAKNLNFTQAYRKQHADITTIAEFTKVTQAAAATLNTDNGDLQGLTVIPIDAQDLDVNGGFDCIRATVADVGVTAQLGVLLYLLSGYMGGRYFGEPVPGVVAD